MKTYSDDLFMLIKSLSKSEQRYFRLFSSLHKGRKVYIKLFDVIVKQCGKENAEYNETVIKKEFHKEHFVKYLSQAKNYLYDLILKSLEAYHSSLDSELRSLLNQAEILLDKRLYERCKAIILKLEQKAVKHEKYLYAFEAGMLKNHLLLQMGTHKKTDTEMKVNYENGNGYLEKFKNICDYSHLQMQMNYLMLQSGRLVRNKKELKKWDVIIKNPLLQDESKAITLNSEIHMCLALVFYYNVTGDLQNVQQYSARVVKLFESNRNLLIKNLNKYVTFLINLLVSYVTLYKHDELWQGIQKLKNISNDYQVKLSTQLEIKIFEFGSSLELDYYQITSQFHKIDIVINEIEQGFTKYSGKITRVREIMLYFGIACMLLINKNYKKSLLWINKILNNLNKMNSEYELIYFSGLLRLILYYELKYFEELPYILKSTYRFFIKKKKLYKVEESILNFLKKSFKISDQQELNNAFMELKEDIIKITKDPLEKKVLEYFDIISWLESKIEKRPLADVIREKNNIFSS